MPPPKAVFAIWPLDMHPDHAAVAEMTRKALFLLNRMDIDLFFFSVLLGYESFHFDPIFTVDITSVYHDKMALVRAHATQNKDGSLERIVQIQSLIFGMKCGMNVGEGFIPLKPEMIQKRNFLYENLTIAPARQTDAATPGL